MSVAGIIIFFFFIILITALQSFTAYIYFNGFFSFKTRKMFFIIPVFVYMLIVKFLNINAGIRMEIFIFFIFVLSTITLYGSVEKKLYHSLSYTFSLTLCELSLSVLMVIQGSNIQTEQIKWLVIYFLINILFYGVVIGIIKALVYFREENSVGLSKEEYMLLSLIPIASLVIIFVSIEIHYIYRLLCCICLILINLSYIIIYDRIVKKNYEIRRISFIEEQNQYYKEYIENQKEILHLRHDLKNMKILIDSAIQKNQNSLACEQIDMLLNSSSMQQNELTGCIALDSILDVKIKSMKEKDISFDLDLRVPIDLKLDEECMLDISSILGNLLDNAIEAVMRLENGIKKEVSIAIYYNDRKLIFNIKNTSKEVLADFSSNIIKSEKIKGRYGIGLSSIKERVDRLKGHYDFVYEDGTYTALIIIEIK